MAESILAEAVGMVAEQGYEPSDSRYDDILIATIQAVATTRAAAENRLARLEQGRMIKEGLEKVAAELRRANFHAAGLETSARL